MLSLTSLGSVKASQIVKFVCWVPSRCLKIGGPDVLDKWLKAQEMLLKCFMENFDPSAIKMEIQLKERTGDLDLVFKKYCE